MRYDNPALQELLAGQYALGALQGAARARFERLLRQDAALRRRVRDWEERLAPLSIDTPPIKPPARVFAAITRRIDGARPGLWQRLSLWRAFSAAGAVVIVVLALTTTFLALRPPAALSPSYVAVLSDSTTQPVLVVTAYKSPWRLGVETLAPPTLPPEKVLQVWAIEKGTGAVRPLIAFTPGQPQSLALTEERWKLVKSAHALSVSIEPAGSNPAAPTTPVLYSGLCLNLKGV
jgi:anti-sigma-K factor RskA